MIVWLLALSLTTVPLVDAVKQKDKAAVRRLLQARVDVNAPEGDGATALHWAAYADDAELVKLLLDAGARADVANAFSITPLYLAATNGNEAIVKALLERGANPRRVSETNVTPLMEAARSGSVGAVRALLTHGADINAKETDRGQTALMWAVARRHTDVVKLLLEHQADLHARTHVRNRMVMLDQGPSRTVKTSMRDASQIAVGGTTALLIGAQSGDAESISLLLAAGADVNDTAPDGNSALVIAAFSGHANVVQLLLERGADPNRSGAGYSALHLAVLRGDLTTLNRLVASGANINARLTKGSPVRRFGTQWALPSTMRGATPLFVAATFLEVGIMRALVAAGADHTLALADGTTPLLAAAGSEVQTEVRPVDVERWALTLDDVGRTPVPRPEADVLDATTVLLDAGADVNQVNEAGNTALHAAASEGATTLIQLLIDRGATLDAKNKEGQTPLALTLPKPARGGRPPEEQSAGLQAAEALLRKLGATQ